MRLNPDCIRDILLLIEQNDKDSSYSYDQSNKLKELGDYTYAEVIYHASQCSKHGFIEGFSLNDEGTCFIVTDITPAGHAFLANIRNDSFFNKIKAICEEIGVSSLKDISQVASLSVAVLIKNHFKIS